jgi:protein-S-isoprenylcysteine O-methyltransferase Ste14
MQEYLAALALVLFFAMVVTRLLVMQRKGTRAFYFGNLDKKDFLIPPFVLFYFYLVFAAAFGWPSVGQPAFFESQIVAWLGVALCWAGLLVIAWSLVSFGRSFRVGIDTEHPDKLVTTGVFAFSRNPLYVAFAFMLLGEFLVFPNWIFLLYVVAGAWLFHRQVLREEAFLKRAYGKEYEDYCRRVRRYL